MYPILVKDQDQFETFVKTLKEKCLFSSANLLELVGEKENEYIVNFKYQNSKELLETKPMKKNQLFEFLDKINKRFDGKIQYEWNNKNSPLSNKLGYFQLNDMPDKIRLDLMSEVETLKAYKTTYIKCSALFFNGNNVIFHKADKFYEIVSYSLNGNCLNIYVGLTLCENLHANKTYKLTEPKNTDDKFCQILALFLLMCAIMIVGCIIFGHCEEQYKNTIIQQSNLINDLQIQIANLTSERDSAINLLNTATIKIDKISAQNAEFLKERIFNHLIVPIAVIICLVMCVATYEGIKKSIEKISLVSNDKQDEAKNVDSKQSKKTYPVVTKLNILKENPPKKMRRNFTTKYD